MHAAGQNGIILVVDKEEVRRFSDVSVAFLHTLGELVRVEESYTPPKLGFVLGIMSLAPEHRDKFPAIYNAPRGQRAEIYPRLMRYDGRLYPRQSTPANCEDVKYLLRIVKQGDRTWVADRVRIQYAQPTSVHSVMMTDTATGEVCAFDAGHLTTQQRAPSRESRPDLVLLFAYYNCTFQAHDTYLELTILH